jgi:dTDP-4-dehydrorhamnose reductase
MRALVFGAAGQLGTAIRTGWREWEIVAPPRAEVDIEDAAAVTSAIRNARADAVINCAAFHNVDLCEAQPERAMAVNAVAVERMARACDAAGSTFVTISTDYVFDGATDRPYVESDVPRPISAYGASKREGERRVAQLHGKALVVRTCGVYGTRPSSTKGYTFVDRILAQAAAGEPIRVVADVTASPTYAGDLADMLAALLQQRRTGLYHACNAGAVSWYEFAREALRQAGVQREIEPLSADAWKAAAKRPKYSALSSALVESFGISVPSWEEGIARYLRER